MAYLARHEGIDDGSEAAVVVGKHRQTDRQTYDDPLSLCQLLSLNTERTSKEQSVDDFQIESSPLLISFTRSVDAGERKLRCQVMTIWHEMGGRRVQLIRLLRAQRGPGGGNGICDLHNDEADDVMMAGIDPGFKSSRTWWQFNWDEDEEICTTLVEG